LIPQLNDNHSRLDEQHGNGLGSGADGECLLWVVSCRWTVRVLADRYTLQSRPSDRDFQFARLNGSFRAAISTGRRNTLVRSHCVAKMYLNQSNI
jgi:hypothetical protein